MEAKSNKKKIIGLNTVMTSTGFLGGDDSETVIVIDNTTVWTGYEFSVSNHGTRLTIKARGDFELQDLKETVGFLHKQLEKIE